MKVAPVVAWTLAGEPAEPLDPRLLPLIHAIGATASLRAAVALCGISYRAGWGLLRDYHGKLGTALVLLERGRGARLTPSGRRLLEAQRKAARRLARILPSLAVEVAPDPPSKVRSKQGPARTLRIAASHDLALAALAASLPPRSRLALEISFMGSLHALHEFVEGRVDVAGFHVPLAGGPASDPAPFLRSLSVRRDRLVRFVDREQGLILPRGNPAKVRHLDDVAAKHLRFINRQRGSGTRLLLDRMIADERIDPDDLDGYAREEFTHRAVAATVASRGADAGFGLRAAAAEYGLAFVPLVRERYFLAVRARDVATPPVADFIRALGSPAFARLVRGLPGYAARGAGSVEAPTVLTATNAER